MGTLVPPEDKDARHKTIGEPPFINRYSNGHSMSHGEQTSQHGRKVSTAENSTLKKTVWNWLVYSPF